MTQFYGNRHSGDLCTMVQCTLFVRLLTNGLVLGLKGTEPYQPGQRDRQSGTPPTAGALRGGDGHAKDECGARGLVHPAPAVVSTLCS